MPKEEGGRHTPFLKGYQPQFFFRTTDVTGVLELPDAIDMVMPGDTTVVSVELFNPIAMEVGQCFAICEGGKTVGAGVVLRILLKSPAPDLAWQNYFHRHRSGWEPLLESGDRAALRNAESGWCQRTVDWDKSDLRCPRIAGFPP